jgi:hypothetical protein
LLVDSTNHFERQASAMDELVSLQGRIDLHIHAYPSLRRRVADDREVAQAAARAGMKGIVIKSHHESTVSRVYLLRPEFPQLNIYGGIALNSSVGGINPTAVEASLRLGGRFVWMPTLDSAFHAQKRRSRAGTGNVQSPDLEGEGEQGISILRDGKLIEEVRQVIGLAVKHSAVTATGHLSFPESYALLRAAREAGAEKLIVNHPFFWVPAFTLEETEQLVDLGAYAEFEFCTDSTMDLVTEAIRKLGAARCVLVSDAGSPNSPIPTESFRVFLQRLWERGVSQEELDLMTITNPAVLLEN